MIKEVYYKCEYCKCKTRDLIKFKKHELTCSDMHTNQLVAKSRLLTLIRFYEKKGYKVSITYHTGDYSSITVYHPDFGKFK